MNADTPLPDDLTTLRQMVRELLATLGELRTTNQELQARIERLVKQLYGPRSERLSPDQLLLFAEPAALPTPPTEPPLVEVQPAKAKQPGHGRTRQTRELPRRQRVADLTEAEKLCPCCGAARVCIGQEVSSRRDFEPASLFWLDTIRPTYLCRHCEQDGQDVQATRAPLPPEPIPHGSIGAGLLAHIVVSKFCDHLPLYRLESIFDRTGWKVSRSTLCDQLSAAANLLLPLYILMCQRVRQSFALHVDETPVALLAPRRTAYAWVYLGDLLHPYTVFDLTPGRGHEYPEKFLAGYQSYLHADAYDGYNPLFAAGATHVGCWAHARRKFYEAKDVEPGPAHTALARIQGLYAVERDAKKLALTGGDLAAYRQQHAQPILDTFATWLAQEVPRALPKNVYGQAVGYAANQWPTLTRYINDGRLAIDNNCAENAVRPLALGRKNWLHIAGDGGLQTAAVLLSFAASAKRNGVEPWSYLRHTFTELAARHDHADLTDLLPDAWADKHSSMPPR